MEEKKKNSKKWMIYTGIALAILAVVVLCLLWGVKDYMDRVPDITPKENVTAIKKQTLNVEDIFDVQCHGEYNLKIWIAESDIEDAAVGSDGKTLYVGSGEGEIFVQADGVGIVAEHVSAENIIIVR